MSSNLYQNMAQEAEFDDPRLIELQGEFRALADALTTAVPRLLKDGAPLPKEILDLAATAGKRFATVRAAVLGEARSEGIPAAELNSEYASLKELDGLLRTLFQHRENRRKLADLNKAADNVLQRVLRITHKDTPVFGPLADCHRAANDFRAGLSEANEESSSQVAAIAAGEHPFCRLLSLVEEADGLDDETWDRYYEEVAGAFGRTLAVAIARQKLIIRPAPPTAAGPSAPPPDAKPMATARKGTEGGAESKTPGPVTVVAPEATTGGAMPHSPDAAEQSGVTSTSVAPAAGEDSRTAEPESGQAVEETEAPSESAPTAKAATGFTERPPARKAEPSVDRLATPAHLSGSVAACEIVAMIRHASGQDRPRLYGELVWRLLADNRLGLAHGLAKVASLGIGCPVPPELIRSVAVSPLVTGTSSPATGDLRDSIRNLHSYVASLADDKDGAADSASVILFATTLRPALLAPISEAGSLLQELHLPQMANDLHDLRRAILVYTRLGIDLSPNILKGVRAQAAWQSDLEALQDKCRRWLGAGRQSTILYAPATDVWRAWLRDDGVLGSLLCAIIGNRQDLAPKCKSDLAALTYDHITSLIGRTDKKIRGRRAELRPIEARADKALRKRAQEALELVEGWLALLDREPSGQEDFRYQQADACRHQMLSAVQSARERLPSAEGGAAIPLHEVASRNIAARLLGDLSRLFDPGAQDCPANILPRHVLHACLLQIPGLRLNDQWEPDWLADEALLEQLLTLAESEEAQWAEVFKAHYDRDDHATTARVLEVLDVSPGAMGEADRNRLKELRDENVRQCRTALEQFSSKVAAEIELAVSHDLLNESTRARLVSIVEDIDPSRVLDFAAAREQLQQVRAEIEDGRNKRVEECQQRLEASGVREKDPAACQRIQTALAEGDFLAANEYIDLVASGQSIPQEDLSVDAFRGFFPDFLREAMTLLGRVDPNELVDAIREGRTVGPVGTGALPKPQAKEAARLLHAWFRVKGRRGNLVPDLSVVVEGIGLRNPSIVQCKDSRSEKECWLRLQTDPVRDRVACSIPAFGSLAGGQYDLLCLWGRPSVDDVLDLAAKRRADGPVLVMYLGQLSEQGRRELAYASRQRHGRRSILVLDEALIVYLCTIRGWRLPAALNCVFPFSLADPYTVTAGLVPSEMFFGRRRERESIVDRFGANLVYGGRQLGKTALLRDVVRECHNPQAGFVATWVDLKVEGIGENRPIRDVWSVIARVLHEGTVLATAQMGADTLLKRVREWLSERDDRRILLLLDEADRFLEGDAAECWANVGRLKGLMDDTDRRFKVVLAGLHNVQRTARDANTPLAHLGTPICIGPLFDDGEWREALALVTAPLFSLGYRFESPELPMRVLSLTNYYPGLIQLFCKALLDHLTNPNLVPFDFRECPPYVITARHLDEAYQNQKLRKAILDRFTWTLDLDPRYRVVALRIALECEERRSEGAMIRGFETSWIRDEVLGLWPQGFEGDSSTEAFRTVLDEMVGVGVLRRSDEHRYTLRSPNVLNLLGTHKEIEDSLLDAARCEPRSDYEPAQFHRAMSDDGLLRSPLTAQQESSLLTPSNGAAIVFGAPAAADAALLGSAIEKAASQVGSFQMLESMTDCGVFLRSLDALMSEDRADGLTIIAVPDGWSEHWVLRTCELLSRKRSRKRLFRVVFLASPTQTWSWVRGEADVKQAAITQGVESFSLKPWSKEAVRRWMDDGGLAPGDPAGGERFVAVTGSFGSLLHDVGRRCRSLPHDWRRILDEFEKEVIGEQLWLDLFGLDSPSRAVLETMAELGEPVSPEDLAALIDGVSARDVQDVLEWAELLSFVSQKGRGKRAVHPLVGRVAAKGTG